MSISGFPTQIQVILGSVFDGSPSVNGLNSGNVLVLNKVTGFDIWTEDGTDTPNLTTNRVRFAPSTSGTTISSVYVYRPFIDFKGANVIPGWGPSYTYGFGINFPPAGTGTDYVFKELFNLTAFSGSFLKYGPVSFLTSYHGGIFSFIEPYSPSQQASFTIVTPTDTVCGPSPFIVWFSDTSTGSVASRVWNFGDGSPLDTTQNPVHVYSAIGKYTVTLTVTFGDLSTSVAILKIHVYSFGSVLAWGLNSVGQLGNNTTDNASSPISICRPGSYTDIAAGSGISIAIDPDGIVWTWGRNTVGELGDNTITLKSSPVSIARPESYVAVTVGGIRGCSYGQNHVLAIDASGMVWAWGSNSGGQLGIGSLTNISSPVSIHRYGYYVEAAAGAFHSLILDSSGNIYGSGLNSSGQIGDDTAVSSSTFVSIAKSGPFISIAAGGNSSFAIDINGMIWAWGDNTSGKLGNLSTDPISSPVSIARSGSYVAVSTSFYHTLAIDDTGMVWAWGKNVKGELGNNEAAGDGTKDRSSPVSICRPGSYVSVYAGGGNPYFSPFEGGFSLAVDSNGMVWAWGTGESGELGTGLENNESSPVSIARIAAYLGAAAGYAHSLTLEPFSYPPANPGAIFSWGYAQHGGLGDGSVINKSSPVSIARPGFYVAITAHGIVGNFATETNSGLAIDSNGMIWSWGRNQKGQLGNNSITSRNSPVSIARSGSYVAVDINRDHTVAIDSNGQILTWGYNNRGQLGDDSIDNKSSPVSTVRSDSYTAVAAGAAFCLAIDSAGMVWSWGENSYGQLGNNEAASDQSKNRSSPVSIRRPGSYIAITAGENQSFAIDDAGMIWAWGLNSAGRLGINSILSRSSPVSIARPGSYSAVSSSLWHTLAIDGATGMIWAWGSNFDGQIGDNSETNRSSPVSIARSGSYIAVSAGGGHSLALDSDGMVWTWGRNIYGELGTGTNFYCSSPVSIIRLGVYSKIAAGVNNSFAIVGGSFTPVTADFSGTPTSGNTPLSVAFTDLSTGGAISWSWDFGDGSPLDTTQNPTHIYIVAGNYTVTLSVNGGISTETKPNYIQATAIIPVGPSGLSVLKVFGNGNLTLNSYVTVTGAITVYPSGTIVTVADELMDTVISPTYDPITFNGKSSYITSLYSNIDIQGTIDGEGYGFPSNTGPGANSTLLDNMGNSISQYGASHAGLGAGQNVPGTISFREEYFTLSSLQADQKFIILSYYPLNPLDVAVNIVHGTPQAYGLDFYVEGNKLYWKTVGLELILSEGDIIRVLYEGDSGITIPIPKKTYGSYDAPTSIGSGSGEAAGGSGVKLVARCGTVNIDGTVNMNGEDGITARSGGGAGGSVWVSAFKIDGTGLISADGGNASYLYAGGGGGGYITLNYDKENTFSGTMSVQGYKEASEGITWIEPIEPFFWEKFTGTVWNTKWWDGTVAPVVLNNNVAMDTSAGDFRTPQVNSLFSISGKNILTDVDFSCGPTEPTSHTSYFKLMVDATNWVGVARDQSSLLAIDSINGILDQTALPYALTPVIFRIHKLDTTFSYQFVDSTAGPQTIRSKDIPGFSTSKFTVRLGTEKVSSDDLNVTWDNFKVFSGIMHDIETTESKIYVDSSNGSDANDGRILTPLKNLFVATAWARHSGTVVLYDGTYNPTEIENKNLTLMGANGAHPLITTVYVQDTTGANWERSCLTLRDCGGMIKNINLSDATVAITTEETDSIEVRNCIISDSSVGISFVGYTREPQIIGNTIKRTSRAIVFDTQCFDPYVYSNVIYDCTNNIEAYDTQNLIVASNTIDGGRSGVYLDRSSFAQVVSNNLTHIGPILSAVQVSSDSSATLYNNNFFASTYPSSGPIIDVSGNIFVDPKYVNYSARDYQIQALSPDRNSGSQRFDRYYLDRRGAKRLSEPSYDIGAYEFIDSTTHPSGAYYVGWNGDDYLNNGTESSKYRTLDRAMVNADASVVIDGGLYDSFFLALRSQEIQINSTIIFPLPHNHVTVYFTLTEDNIAGKFVKLPGYMGGLGSDVKNIALNVIQGPLLDVGDDYVMANGCISWEGKTIDGILSVGDILRAIYVIDEGKALTTLRLQTHDSQIDVSDLAFVSVNGSDSSGTGSSSNPYKTIQKALQDSSASNILVLSGEFELFSGVDNKTLVAFADRTNLEDSSRRYLEDIFWTLNTALPNHTINDSLWNLDASSFIQEGYIGLTYDGVNTSEVTSVFSFTPNYEVGIELRQTVDPINFSVHNADNTAIISYNNSDWTSTLYTGDATYSCWSNTGTVERTPFTEYIYIGGDATINKSVPLNFALDSSNVALNIVGGGSQETGTDFYIQDSHIKWDGKGLESEIVVGDTLRVIYYARELSNLLQFRLAVNDGLFTVMGRGVSGSWNRLMKRTLLSDSSSPWSASFYMDRTGSVVDRSITYGHGYGSKFHLIASTITGTDRDEPYALKTWRQPITLY